MYKRQAIGSDSVSACSAVAPISRDSASAHGTVPSVGNDYVSIRSAVAPIGSDSESVPGSLALTHDNNEPDLSLIHI